MKTQMQKIVRVLVLAGALLAPMIGATVSAQTPEAVGCAGVATPDAMSGTDHGAVGHSTPAAGMDHSQVDDSTPMAEVEFDLMYIDMMIPHHESIIALANVAQDELTDPRLIQMAEAIVATQDAEITELEQLRQEWYGDAEPVSMEAMHGMPGMSGDMAGMEEQMSAEWQVQAFCGAENKDLAFIEQTIPHHQMAIDTSEAALKHAEHQEIKDIAQNVIDAQQTEIDKLEAIRAEIAGEATPES
jgi:uncharacterized protein (DUF305 family)